MPRSLDWIISHSFSGKVVLSEIPYSVGRGRRTANSTSQVWDKSGFQWILGQPGLQSGKTLSQKKQTEFIIFSDVSVGQFARQWGSSKDKGACPASLTTQNRLWNFVLLHPHPYHDMWEPAFKTTHIHTLNFKRLSVWPKISKMGQ